MFVLLTGRKYSVHESDIPKVWEVFADKRFLFIGSEGSNSQGRLKPEEGIPIAIMEMTTAIHFARPIKKLIGRNGRLFGICERQAGGLKFSGLMLLILLVGCVCAEAQNSAGLTLRGIMPATQRLDIAPIATTSSAHGLTVLLGTSSNADAGYAVTLQSKTLRVRANGAGVSYEVNYDGHPLTLTSGAETFLFKHTGERSAPKTLEISNPSATSEDIVSLTIISQ